MKPVARLEPYGGKWILVDLAPAPEQREIGLDLFSADQLRQAKVEVLREAAEACPGYAKASNLREYIRSMADEIERSKT